jgi:hypothetical protein
MGNERDDVTRRGVPVPPGPPGAAARRNHRAIPAMREECSHFPWQKCNRMGNGILSLPPLPPQLAVGGGHGARREPAVRDRGDARRAGSSQAPSAVTMTARDRAARIRPRCDSRRAVYMGPFCEAVPYTPASLASARARTLCGRSIWRTAIPFGCTPPRIREAAWLRLETLRGRPTAALASAQPVHDGDPYSGALGQSSRVCDTVGAHHA